MKEIITLQIGDYANFVGSHFWNIQDECLGLQSEPQADPVFHDPGINFDVLYRAGETQQGVSTYLPRLLAIGARGSLGAIKSSGSLYGGQTSNTESSSVSTWDNRRVSKYKADPIPKSEFLQSLENEEQEGNWSGNMDDEKVGDEDHIAQSLEDSVQFWTDFSKVHFHPLSLYEIEGLWHGVPQFDDFGSSRGILTSYMKEEIDDRLRVFAEEADQLQGLQFVIDDSDGFAGISIDILQAVADEYSKTPLMLYTVRSPASFFKRPQSSTVRAALHNAISLSELSGFTDCFIPMGLPSFSSGALSKHLQIDESKEYHTSAVYGASLSCITLPLRMQAAGPITKKSGIGSIDMGSFMHLLSGETGRHISVLDVALPAPVIPGAEKLGRFDYTRFQTLMSNISSPDSSSDDGANALVLEGALMAESGDRASVEEVSGCLCMHSKQGARNLHSLNHLAVSLCPLPIPLPFPRLFGPQIGERGELLKKPRRSGSSVTSAPIAARISSRSSAVLPYVKGRLSNLLLSTRSKSTGSQVLQEWGFQKEEVQELCESLSKTIAAYGNKNRGDMSFSDCSDDSE